MDPDNDADEKKGEGEGTTRPLTPSLEHVLLENGSLPPPAKRQKMDPSAFSEKCLMRGLDVDANLFDSDIEAGDYYGGLQNSNSNSEEWLQYINNGYFEPDSSGSSASASQHGNTLFSPLPSQEEKEPEEKREKRGRKRKQKANSPSIPVVDLTEDNDNPYKNLKANLDISFPQQKIPYENRLISTVINKNWQKAKKIGLTEPCIIALIREFEDQPGNLFMDIFGYWDDIKTYYPGDDDATMFNKLLNLLLEIYVNRMVVNHLARLSRFFKTLNLSDEQKLILNQLLPTIPSQKNLLDWKIWGDTIQYFCYELIFNNTYCEQYLGICRQNKLVNCNFISKVARAGSERFGSYNSTRAVKP